MPNTYTDLLMITYNRPTYTRLALGRLLDTCDAATRVWVWHNGNHKETLEVVRSFLGHRALYQFHHSPMNQKLRLPTNWFWNQSDGKYLGKVDDDCFAPEGWVETLRRAHEDVGEFGVIGCWGFMEEDFEYDLARGKIKEFAGKHQLLQNFWIAGRGYLMKRECIERHGLIRAKESFTDYCIRLAKNDWVNGWYYPLMIMDHFDDPRSPHTLLRTDQDLRNQMPLSVSLYEGDATTLASWTEGLMRTARRVQVASIDKRDYSSWRILMRKLRRRMRRILPPVTAPAATVPLQRRIPNELNRSSTEYRSNNSGM